jgi:hypothetical protein
MKKEQGEIDYFKAAHVGSQYEYYLKNKDKGITEEELERRRAAKRGIKL